jgi:hypothetical protein
MHHLDRAAGETEGHRPQRPSARPVENGVDARGEEAAFRETFRRRFRARFF